MLSVKLVPVDVLFDLLGKIRARFLPWRPEYRSQVTYTKFTRLDQSIGG